MIGGRSLSYVPRPLRLFARRRGGSSGSGCLRPFFPHVLVQLVGLELVANEAIVRQRIVEVLLKLLPDLAQAFAVDVELT